MGTLSESIDKTGLTRALAIELAPIRVNAVSPGVVRTPLWDDMLEADREALYRRVGDALPVGRVGEPSDIAEAYLYLMRARFSTGQVITSTAARCWCGGRAPVIAMNGKCSVQLLEQGPQRRLLRRTQAA